MKISWTGQYMIIPDSWWREEDTDKQNVWQVEKEKEFVAERCVGPVRHEHVGIYTIKAVDLTKGCDAGPAA